MRICILPSCRCRCCKRDSASTDILLPGFRLLYDYPVPDRFTIQRVAPYLFRVAFH